MECLLENLQELVLEADEEFVLESKRPMTKIPLLILYGTMFLCIFHNVIKILRMRDFECSICLLVFLQMHLLSIFKRHIFNVLSDVSLGNYWI